MRDPTNWSTPGSPRTSRNPPRNSRIIPVTCSATYRGLRKSRLRLERLALDLALAHEPERERGAGEAEPGAPSVRTSLKPARKPSRAALGDAPRGAAAGRAASAWSRVPEEAASTSWRGWSPAAAGVPAGQLGDLVGAAADEDRAPDGDADGDADLAEGVVDPGRHAALLLRHDADRDVGDHRVEEADADARDEEAAEQRRPLVAGVDAAPSAAGRRRRRRGRAPSAAAPGTRESSAPATGAAKKLASVIGR